MEYTEQEIIKGFINKDTHILNYIYDEYLPPVRYHIIHNSGCSADAMEVFQQAIVITYDKLRKAKFTLSCSLKTYILSVCRNLWLKELRHRSSRLYYSMDATDEINIAYEEHPENVEIEEVKTYLYQKHFLSLGKTCKKILKLQMDNSCFKEIAKKMGYANENLARKKRYRCMRKLIDLIKSDPEFNKLKDDNDEI